MPNSNLSNVSVNPSADLATLWLRLKADPAQPQVWMHLALQYVAAGLNWQAGYAARQVLRLDANLATELQASIRAEWRDPAQSDGQLGRSEIRDAGVLVTQFTSFVSAHPGDWLSWLYLARLNEMLGRFEDGRNATQRAQALEIIPGETLHWLGVWRLNAGDAQGAVAAFSQLLDIRPVRFGSMMYLGDALLRLGNTTAAEKAFARASLSPNPDFLLTLTARSYGHNYWQEAMQILRKAIDLRPHNVAAWLALAKIQSEVYELAACQVSLQSVFALEPANKEAALLQAGLHGRMGDAKAHLRRLQKEYADSADPLSRIASSIAMTSLYQDELTAAEVAALHRQLCAPIEGYFKPKSDFSNQWTADRKIRIGYVTGDLHRQHPVNIYLLPVLLRHDHERFEIHIYHTGTMFDHYTRQAKACADRWVEAAGLDDHALHQLIVADRIDVLVDLAGHTSSHRLGVFALRAAPVQATFLGYPYSTGLSCIDWIVGDATVTPLAHAEWYSEQIAQLPGSVFCWAPVDEYPLPGARPTDAPVVFGSFNNAMKLSNRTVALWSRILNVLPEAKLLLKAPALRDAAVQSRFASLFARHGIRADRIIFRGPTGLAEMMQEYADMDIALDPIPYNGGTTTQQALWMGVPVIALEGDHFVSRMGASFLRTLGQADWVAQDEDDYVQIALLLAEQISQVRRSRAGLRSQMRESALSDIATYTHELESLFLRMWQNRVAGMTNKSQVHMGLSAVTALPAMCSSNRSETSN